MRSHSSLVKIVKCVIATGWMKSKVIWSALFSKEKMCDIEKNKLLNAQKSRISHKFAQ